MNPTQTHEDSNIGLTMEGKMIALYEWLGWTEIEIGGLLIFPYSGFPPGPRIIGAKKQQLPPLTLDLMHEAVQLLRYVKGNQFQWLQYTRELFKVIWNREAEPCDHISDGIAWDVIEATKEQRLEALLKTIGTA